MQQQLLQAGLCIALRAWQWCCSRLGLWGAAASGLAAAAAGLPHAGSGLLAGLCHQLRAQRCSKDRQRQRMCHS